MERKILHRALRQVMVASTDLRGCVERGVAAAGDRAVRVRPRHQQAVRRLRVPRPRPAHQQIRNLRGGISSYSHRLLVSYISDNQLERKHFITLIKPSSDNDSDLGRCENEGPGGPVPRDTWRT